MLSGKQKAQLLISLLEDNSAQVLKQMDETMAKVLTSSLEDAPELNENELQEFFKETMEKLESAEAEVTFEIANPDDVTEDTEDELEEKPELNQIEEENEIEEIEEEEEENPYPDNYRNIEKIIELLEKQEPQIIAFFLAKVDDQLRKDVKENMSEELLDQINYLNIEKMPISDKIFQKIFDSIVIKTEEEMKMSDDDMAL